MVASLSEAYTGVETLIRQNNPLPQFYQARSMLVLEEAGLAKQMATGSNTVMIAALNKEFNKSSIYPENSGQNRGKGGTIET